VQAETLMVVTAGWRREYTLHLTSFDEAYGFFMLLTPTSMKSHSMKELLLIVT